MAALPLAAIVAGLAACGGPSATFDIGEAPATPEVSARQLPLHIPPEFGVRPGDETASPTRVPDRPYAAGGLSAGESALLSQAGASRADPRIRTLIDQESTSLAVVDPRAIERVVLGATPVPPPGMTIRRTGSRVIDDPLSLF